MSRNVVWSPKATADYLEHLAYIAEDNPAAASLVQGRIDEAILKLARRPIGRPGRIAGVYEKSVLNTSLIAAYDLPDQDTLHILHIIHTLRLWPKGKWPK
jgi:toxin ParE1/3/4